jgi:hypothetical protein
VGVVEVVGEIVAAGAPQSEKQVPHPLARSWWFKSNQAYQSNTVNTRVHGKRIKHSRSAQLPAYQAMHLGIANLDNEERAFKKDDV